MRVGMYYVITSRGVCSGKTIPEINQKIKGKFDKKEFTPCGADMVLKATDSDIDFVQDKRLLSQIMFSQFFKKDSSVKIMVIFNLILTCMSLFINT